VAKVNVKATHGRQPPCFLCVGAFQPAVWQGLASSFCPGRESPGPQYTSAILLRTPSSKQNRRQISLGASCVVRPPSPQDPQGAMLLGWGFGGEGEEIGQELFYDLDFKIYRVLLCRLEVFAARNQVIEFTFIVLLIDL